MPILPNPRHESFAQALAKGKSAAEAYEAAGYKPSRSAASRLSTNVNIEARVAELVGKGADKAEVTIARVLDEMRRLGFSDIRKAFDENGNLKPVSAWDDDTAAAISSVEVVTRPGADVDEDGNRQVEYVHKIKVWDKNSALEKLAKHLGMFVERVDHTSSDGSMTPKPSVIEFVAPQIDDASDD